jgi:hypothetical protein
LDRCKPFIASLNEWGAAGKKVIVIDDRSTVVQWQFTAKKVQASYGNVRMRVFTCSGALQTAVKIPVYPRLCIPHPAFAIGSWHGRVFCDVIKHVYMEPER